MEHSADVTLAARARTAHAPGAERGVESLAQSLAAQLGGDDTPLVLTFSSPEIPGGPLASRLEQLLVAPVIGCSTAGQFSNRAASHDGVAATAFSRSVVQRVASRLVEFDGRPIVEAVDDALGAIGAQLGTPVRDLDPRRHVGLVLIDGLSANEEAVNAALSACAPYIPFVGGSAGDDLRYVHTEVYRNEQCSGSGAVIAIIEAAVPCTVFRTCSFVPAGRAFRITRADPATRTVYEFDGRPVLDAYAESLGLPASDLDEQVFRRHPLGLMLGPDPWIRSPRRRRADRGLEFFCQVLEGMEVELMHASNVIEDTAASFSDAVADVGGRASGAVLFNCVLRRLEFDQRALHGAFLGAFGDAPIAGFHTYGETYVGHTNQTLTGIVFGT